MYIFSLLIFANFVLSAIELGYLSIAPSDKNPSILCLKNPVSFEWWNIVYIGRYILYDWIAWKGSVVLHSIYLRNSFYICAFLLMLWNLLQNNSNYIESFILKSSPWSPLCIHLLWYMTQSVYWNVIEFIQLDIRMPVTVYLQFIYFCAITVLWLAGPWPHIQK